MARLKKIGTCRITPGRLRHGFLPIRKGFQIPISIMSGKKKGKMCFVCGGVHGDELNGMKLVHMLMTSIDPKDLSGTIIFIPILNTLGFHKQSRLVPEDNRDLNRCFGKRGSSLSYAIAKKFSDEIIRRCDFGIDFHDYGEREVMLPHSRVHHNMDSEENTGSTLEMGRLFGTKVILHRDGDRGMMSIESFSKLKKPVLTIEVGGGLVLWNDYLENAYTGIMNILIHNDFLKGKIKLPREQYLIKDLDRFKYISRREGLVYKKVKVGDRVHKGDVIAVIYDPLTRRKTEMKSKNCGFVFSLIMRNKINRGETVGAILQSHDCDLHKTKRQKEFAVIRNYPNIWDFANGNGNSNNNNYESKK